MSVNRDTHTSDFVIASNHILRDDRLSLRAKGLLVQMLSLPPEWDYNITGLACINREGRDAIRSAVRELERCGYVVRRKSTDPLGHFASGIYDIFETPLTEAPTAGSPSAELTAQ